MKRLESNSLELNIIKNKSFGKERAFYNSKNLYLKNVSFKGKEDGESALKESTKIYVDECNFLLRYPLWHVSKSYFINSKFEETCRAPFWYDNKLFLEHIEMKSPKAFRECKNIDINKSTIIGDEPFWKCKNISINNSDVDGVYAFFNSKKVKLNDVYFKGKYSFQYIKNLVLENCNLDTKDAFWHSKNVVCKNCKIKGEYLGWYSENIVFDHCVIESHQPLCYAKNIRFIDCKMPNSDLAFEYSEVYGNIKGKVDSVKNPIKGKIFIDRITNLILEDSKKKLRCKIITKK